MILTFTLCKNGKFSHKVSITIKNPNRYQDLQKTCLEHKANEKFINCNSGTSVMIYLFSIIELILNEEPITQVVSFEKMEEVLSLLIELDFSASRCFEYAIRFFLKYPIDDVIKSSVLKQSVVTLTILEVLHPIQNEYFIQKIKESNKYFQNYFSTMPCISSSLAISINNYNCYNIELIKKLFYLISDETGTGPDLIKLCFLYYNALFLHQSPYGHAVADTYFGIKPIRVHNDIEGFEHFGVILCTEFTEIMKCNDKILTIQNISTLNNSLVGWASRFNEYGNTSFLHEICSDGKADVVVSMIKQWMIYYSIYYRSPIIYQFILKKYPIKAKLISMEDKIIDLIVNDYYLMDYFIDAQFFERNNIHNVTKIIGTDWTVERKTFLVDKLYNTNQIENHIYDMCHFYIHGKKDCELISLSDLLYFVNKNDDRFIEYQLQQHNKLNKNMSYHLFKHLRKVVYDQTYIIRYFEMLSQFGIIPRQFYILMTIYFGSGSIKSFDECCSLIEMCMEKNDQACIDKILVIYAHQHKTKLNFKEQIKLFKIISILPNMISIVAGAIVLDLLDEEFKYRYQAMYSPTTQSRDIYEELEYIALSQDYKYLAHCQNFEDKFQLLHSVFTYDNYFEIVDHLFIHEILTAEHLCYFFYLNEMSRTSQEEFIFETNIIDEIEFAIKNSLLDYFTYLYECFTIDTKIITDVISKYAYSLDILFVCYVAKLIKNGHEMMHQLYLDGIIPSFMIYYYINDQRFVFNNHNDLKNELHYAFYHNFSGYFFQLIHAHYPFFNFIINMIFMMFSENEITPEFHADLKKTFDQYPPPTLNVNGVIKPLHYNSRFDDTFGVIFWHEYVN